MSVLVAGVFRAPQEALDRLRPHMAEMIDASRAEAGCLTYSYAEDVLEPGLIRVFEAWSDAAALEAHLASPHIARWRSAWAELGVGGRDLTLYDVAGARPT